MGIMSEIHVIDMAGRSIFSHFTRLAVFFIALGITVWLINNIPTLIRLLIK